MQSETSFSAIDIARTLIRNPNEVVDLPTYDNICESFCQDRPIEDLSPKDKQTIFSLEAGIHELTYFGFDESQIETILEAFYDVHEELGLDHNMDKMRIKTRSERLQLIAFVCASFPYGPPLLASDFNMLALPTETTIEIDRNLNMLTTKLAGRLMSLRTENPYLFTPLAPPKDMSDSQSMHI